MTWQELADFINQKMTEEQRKDTVAVYVQSVDEYISAAEGGVSFQITGEDEDVLDPNSYYLDVDA